MFSPPLSGFELLCHKLGARPGFIVVLVWMKGYRNGCKIHFKKSKRDKLKPSGCEGWIMDHRDKRYCQTKTPTLERDGGRGFSALFNHPTSHHFLITPLFFRIIFKSIKYQEKKHSSRLPRTLSRIFKLALLYKLIHLQYYKQQILTFEQQQNIAW